MKVIICGAGQVGYSIARQLSAENNDVTVIDLNGDLIQRLGESLEVKAITGHAAHPEVLEAAGAPAADMLIAVTYSDEVNMVACQIGHSLFNIPSKIARVRHQGYLLPAYQGLFSKDNLPIDVIISPEREVAQAVIRRLHVPGALDMIPFAGGQLKAIAVRCMPDSPLANLPIHLIRQRVTMLNMAIVAIIHEDRLVVPTKDTVLHEGDEVYFVVTQRDVRKSMALFGHEEKEAQRLLILGGGNIGLYIAEELEQDDIDTRVKLIEVSKDRAEHIAGLLKDTTVIHGSGLDREILAEANVNVTDTIIAVTNDDEVNILGSLLAKRDGCKRCITLINNVSYVPLLSNLGIDVTVNPRETTISSILQHVRRGKIKSVHSIRDGLAELIEAEAVTTSSLIGKTLKTLELPPGVLLAAVVRGAEVIFPDEDTIIQENDRIIILSAANMVKRVERLFSVSIEYF